MVNDGLKGRNVKIHLSDPLEFKVLIKDTYSLTFIHPSLYEDL